MSLLKDLFNPKSIRALSLQVKRAYPKFAAEDFTRNASKGLSSLEMKARIKQIAHALHRHLPQDLTKSLPIIVKAVASAENPDGADRFDAWPLCQYVEEYGQENLTLSMEALKNITHTMSAEFAVRPFLLRYGQDALAIMKKWAHHESVHVRRLASEGSRPRLPWGQRLPAFVQDPKLTLPILRQLRHDPELYVRKSVANHLNDFSKDHPDWLVEELRTWNEEFPQDKNVQWILRHACRSLVKAGHKEALAMLGFGKASFTKTQLSLTPKKIKLGAHINLEFTATPKESGAWVVDYAIHHRKANGGTTPKVFKWAKLQAKKGEPITIAKKHAVKKITTRKYYSGEQGVEIFINGKSAAKGAFSLTL